MPEGKIIKALSGFYYVLDESQDKIIQCRGRGIFRKNKITPLVGDYAVYQAENDKEGYLLEIKERTNELIRPPISNVDQAVLVFSAVQPAFSTSAVNLNKQSNPLIHRDSQGLCTTHLTQTGGQNKFSLQTSPPVLPG